MEKLRFNSDNLQQVIQERKITQIKLAEMVGVRREHISRIINRKATPSVSLASCIAYGVEGSDGRFVYYRIVFIIV